MTTYALPGIVVALSIVFFALGVAPALYQTFALLALAYAAAVPAPGHGTRCATGCRASAPSLEEAARMLGRSPCGRVPPGHGAARSGPAVVAGAALVFLTTAKELPMTLILRADRLLDRSRPRSGAPSARASTRARRRAPLLLVALSIGSVALLLRGDERA